MNTVLSSQFQMAMVIDLPLNLNPEGFLKILQQVQFHPGDDFDLLHIPKGRVIMAHKRRTSGFAFVNGNKAGPQI